MQFIIRYLVFVLLAAGAVAHAAAAADLTVVSTVTVRGKTSTATAYYTETAMRTSDGQSDVIFDFGNGTMITIDHKKKSWSEASFADLREKMKEVERLMDDNPMIASMIGQATDATVEKLGSSREVAGYACQDYRVTMGMKLRFDVCAAPGIDPPIDIFEARKMATLMMGPMAAHLNKLYDALGEVQGFPLVTETAMQMMGMNLNTRQEATEVRNGVPGDAFDVPANYKKKKSAF